MVDFRKHMLDGMTPERREQYLEDERHLKARKAEEADKNDKDFLRSFEYCVKNLTSRDFQPKQRVTTYEDAFITIFIPEMLKRFAKLTDNNLGIDPPAPKSKDDTELRFELIEKD